MAFLKSKTRELIMVALQSYGKQGATRDEIVELVRDELDEGIGMPNKAVGISLGLMQQDNEVREHRGRWYLAEDMPQPQNAPPRTNGAKVQVATFATKRSNKQVTIYNTPEVFDDIIGIQVFMKKEWWRLPVFGSMRICIGKDAPMWSPEQEMYYEVEVLRLVHRGGGTTERRPNPKDILVIAPED